MSNRINNDIKIQKYVITFKYIYLSKGKNMWIVYPFLIAFCLILSSPGIADILRFKDGSSVDIGHDYWEDGGKIFVRRSGGTVGFSKKDVLRIEKTHPSKREEIPPPEKRVLEKEPDREEKETTAAPASTRPDELMARAMEAGERTKEVLRLIKDVKPSEKVRLEHAARELDILQREVEELKTTPADSTFIEGIHDFLGKVSEAIDIGRSTMEGEDRTQLDRGIDLIDEAQSQIQKGRQIIKE